MSPTVLKAKLPVWREPNEPKLPPAILTPNEQAAANGGRSYGSARVTPPAEVPKA
jgi:hypothetical protein